MTIPDPVKRQLRSEVGFGCPVEGCGVPYLTYHHFDPPRRVREHNEPGGMIGLCRKHHDDAEGGAFTADQLRRLKLEGRERNRRIRGEFQWRRQQLLVHVGRTLTFETPIPLAFNGIPIVWLTRDDNGELLLSINMLTTSILPRLRMFENDWVSVGNPTDLKAPPFGRKLRAIYPNGDKIRIEFKTIKDSVGLAAELPQMGGAKKWADEMTISNDAHAPELAFPAVLVDIDLELPDVGISINASGVKTAASLKKGECYGSHAPCAVSLGHLSSPFPTILNSISIARDQPLLRFASMNDNILWSVSDRRFQRMMFLLDGYDFQNCNFDQCWFALRGQPFLLRDSDLGSSTTLIRSQELQNSYDIFKGLAEAGFPNFIDLGERLGAAASQGHRNSAKNKTT